MRKIIALSAALSVLSATAAVSQIQSPEPQQSTPPAATGQPQITTPPVGTPPTPQMQPPSATAPSPPSGPGQQSFLNQQQPGQMLASDLMRRSIHGSNNERIGEVSDLLVTPNGEIVAALVGVGGFLGIGEKTVAIPFNSLQRAPGSDQLTASFSRQDLENAPQFVTTRGRSSDTGTSGSKSGTQR